jgi:hypothetical protein
MTTSDRSPNEAYAEQVANIIDATPRTGSHQPARAVELFIKNRRTPTSVEGLPPQEKVELERMFRGQDLATILETGMMSEGGREDFDDSYPLDLEVADVVDDRDAVVYRMYGMNYGAMFLMRTDRLECVAFASQHSVELWRLEQREVFWAMDRALRRGGHGFKQPVSFEWSNDERWAEIAKKDPGTVASEPYVRKQFAGD